MTQILHETVSHPQKKSTSAIVIDLVLTVFHIVAFLLNRIVSAILRSSDDVFFELLLSQSNNSSPAFFYFSLRFLFSCDVIFTYANTQGSDAEMQINGNSKCKK
jgi:hypothetical protein